MTYQRTIPIEFNHCDPAGIVFYPRYFEMTNSVIENFFADVVGRSFAQMHSGAQNGAQNGVPTVAIEATFVAPSRLGDKVLFALQVLTVGRTSLGVRITGVCDGQDRMRADLTLVWIDAMKAAPWPDAMRAALVKYRETSA